MLDQLDFQLPKRLIAQRPAEPRDQARLLVYRRSDQSITDSNFYNLEEFLPSKTSLVINRAKVDKCRLQFGKVEIFLLQTVNNRTAVAMVRPGKKFPLNAVVKLAEEIEVKVTDINGEGHRTLEFSADLDSEAIKKHQLTPLPPYIKQDESLSEQYQTIYAKDPGSKAAPTAGLHFTEGLMARIKQKHPVIEVTLDVGLGTFAPVTKANLETKKLHAETYSISEAAAQQLNQAEHITAVGTTSTRLLESNVAKNAAKRQFQPVSDVSTEIFIQPEDRLQAIDAMITNFHLPKTSLLMLVVAMIGTPDSDGNQVVEPVSELKRIYQHAVAQEYRFYSFGDAMLVL